jgi:DNA-binding NarL/FixJ family response regulator
LFPEARSAKKGEVNNPISHPNQEKQRPTAFPYRVVLADDDVLYRRVLRDILEGGQNLEVAGEAGDGLELLSLLGSFLSSPQMAIVDISMPNLGGIEATAAVKKTHPGMKILIVSIHREKEYVREALSAGADGYLLKEDVDKELFSAIEKIQGGGVYVSPLLMGAVGV